MKKRGYREWRTGDLRFVAMHISHMTIAEIAEELGRTQVQTEKFVHKNRDTIEALRKEYKR